MNTSFFLWVYIPLILYACSILIIYRSKRVSEKQININLLGLIKFPVEISFQSALKGIYIKHTMVLIFSIAIFLYYLFLDFSSFFPRDMKMTVHFNDREGISETLSELEIKEVNGLVISMNDKNIDEFFRSSDSVIDRYLGYDSFYHSSIIENNNTLEIDGSVRFIVKKTKEIQKYRIVSSNGNLKHKCKIKDKGVQELNVYFKKVITQNDEIKINNVKQIWNGIIISPCFSQNLIVDGKGTKKFEAMLYGVTKVNIIPYPQFSNTLYMVRKNDSLIPIGFAKYYEY